MKKHITLIAAFSALFLIVGCGPPKVEPIVEVETNETAFVIPMEGSSKGGQAQFESISFLEEKKVATKRIVIPIRERKIGRAWQWWAYEWIPLVRVVSVDRTPVTREWTSDSEKSSNATSAVEVETKESIGALVGINATAYIDEADTATFLYYYRSQPLSKVIDTNVRGVVQTELSEQFAQYSLNEAMANKNEIFEAVRKKIIPHFKEYGITITSFGLAEGLTFTDEEIQDSINKAYTAEKQIEQARFEKQVQEEVNMKQLSIAANERLMAEEFAKAAEAREKQVQVEVERMKADALLKFAEKWDGSSVPYFISLGQSGSPEMLMQMPQVK